MAGLSRNFLLKQKAFPDDPPASYDSTFMDFYGSGMGTMNGTNYLPGFANDAGNYYSITFAINSSTAMTYKQGDGTTITSGSWNGNWNASEVADGSGNSGNYFSGIYMDTTDNALYAVVQDTNASPSQYGLAKIDRFGSSSLIGGSWYNVAAADNTAVGVGASWIMPLRRTGGDGSGNFELISAYSPSNNYRMIKYTFNVSTGAMTTSDVLPAASTNADLWYYPMLGPTSNNIILGAGYSDTTGDSGHVRGYLINTSTGKHTARYTILANNISGGGMSAFYRGTAIGRAIYWRGKVLIGNGDGNIAAYDETDVFNYIDQMADYYGIL